MFAYIFINLGKHDFLKIFLTLHEYELNIKCWESSLCFEKGHVKCQLVPVDPPAMMKALVNCLNVDAHLCLYSPWSLVVFLCMQEHNFNTGL